jgi:histidinol-phosphate/aromatic aminotransferase/cobyric acid decarboxylase-like protein/choline kinase
MQALILAAGMGKRLGKLTDSDTKCMLEVNGIKLIDRALKAIEDAGIRKLCVVIGYKGDRVQKYLGSNWGKIEISYIENVDYSKTNNIYSLLLAADFLKREDTLLLESDLIFESEVIAKIVDDPRENIVLVDKFESWMDGTVVTFNENRIINKFISKQDQAVIENKNFYKTVNIYKFSADFSNNIYIPFLETYCKSVGLNEYYESVLSTIANLNQENLFALEINPYLWHEIDDVIDHSNASTMFAPLEELHSAYSKRFGGYWRFPKLVDYCYLVNPYFPTQNFEDLMKFEFRTLLAEYPSGLRVQESMAANLFKIDESLITVGNGASELINALANSLPNSTIGYFNPSFDEYAARFSKHNLVAVDGFDFSPAELLESVVELSEKCDYVVLVNPDNPTGRFIDPQEIVGLLGTLKENDCSLILDESFVDFSLQFESATLILEKVLMEFPNLIIIKSISKSYGVAGIRLGVMVTSNMTTLSRVREALPVWNINSFAEKFLQKITYFQKEYWTSCRKLAEARAEFSSALRGTGIKVWESAANFLMVELPPEMNSTEFCNYMIKQNMLIKSLSGKKGIPGENFLRVSVKSINENKEFVNAVRIFASRFSN